MKAVMLSISWCLIVFLILLTLYRIVPPETQYAIAEYFEVYGDELIMDFVLYAFFGLAIVISSVLTFFLYLFMRKN